MLIETAAVLYADSGRLGVSSPSLPFQFLPHNTQECRSTVEATID